MNQKKGIKSQLSLVSDERVLDYNQAFSGFVVGFCLFVAVFATVLAVAFVVAFVVFGFDFPVDVVDGAGREVIEEVGAVCEGGRLGVAGLDIDDVADCVTNGLR